MAFDDIFKDLNLGDNLTNFRKNTDNLMTDVKTNVLTPVSAVMEKAKDGLALVKSTDSKVQSMLTNFRSQAVEQMDGILGALSGGLLNTSDITKAVRYDQNGFSFDSSSLSSAIGNKIGLDLSSKDAFISQMSSTISSEFNRISNGAFGGLLSVDGKGFRVNGDWRGIVGQGVLNTFLRYTDAEDLVDYSITNSFYNSLLYNAADYGMKDSYASIFNKYTSPEAARDGLTEAIGRMLNKGDLESINAVLDLLDNQNKTMIMAKYPDFLESLLSNFTFDTDVTPADYPAIRDRLYRVINEITYRSQWWLRYTQFGYVYDLSLVNRLSTDMLTLLSIDENIIPLLCARNIFITDGAVNVLKQSFPQAPVV